MGKGGYSLCNRCSTFIVSCTMVCEGSRTQLIRPRVIGHREGYVLIKCTNSDDVNLILEGGPYSMGDRTIVTCK